MGSPLFPLYVTVEQVVYVMANRTLSLAEVSGIVQTGFNRGSGGRVRFRSLLREDTQFATVENVEVTEGALTRFPTAIPTRSPSNTPTKQPSSAPTLQPSTFIEQLSLEPTRPSTNSPSTTSATFDPTSSEPTIAITFVPTALSVTPTPTTTIKPTLTIPSPNSSAQSPEQSRKVSNADLITIFIAVGVILFLIVVCCLRFIWRRRSRSKNEETGQSRLHLRTNVNEGNKGSTNSNIPDHLVLLDEDSRSLANSTLGDQTAGGFRKPPPPPKPVGTIKEERPGNTEKKPLQAPNSFDENSLYTSHFTPSFLASGAGENVAKGMAMSKMSSAASSAGSGSFMLPPSVLPYEDEDSFIFPSQDMDGSVSSSFCSTAAESGAVESSLYSDSVTSSSLVMSETNHTRSNSATAIYNVTSDVHHYTEGNREEKEEEDDPFGVDLFADSGRRLVETTKTNDQAKAMLTSQALEKETMPVSAFAPFVTGEERPVLKFHFDAEAQSNLDNGGSITGFHGTDNVKLRSADSSSSSLMKKVETYLLGTSTLQDSSYASGIDEEKREVDSDAEVEKIDGESLREGARNPLVDLLADTQLLDRSVSPSSWRGSTVQPLECEEATKTSPNHFRPISKDGFSVESRSLPSQTSISEDEESVFRPVVALATASSGPSTHKDDGLGILGVQPRREQRDLVENRSAESSSTGLSNPWLFDVVEKTLGPKSVSADIESLSGRSERSQKSHTSFKSQRSSKSNHSNRSYNVPASGKYKGRGEGRIRSAAASIASYKSNHTAPFKPTSLQHDLNRLERQLAALHQAEDEPVVDQVTASSVTLSSAGAKSRSTFSSKLTRTGARLVKRKRIIVEVPRGKLGVVLANRNDGKGTFVSEVRPDSSLKGILSLGDKLGK